MNQWNSVGLRQESVFHLAVERKEMIEELHQIQAAQFHCQSAGWHRVGLTSGNGLVLDRLRIEWS